MGARPIYLDASVARNMVFGPVPNFSGIAATRYAALF
jgi:hypothetical protein